MLLRSGPFLLSAIFLSLGASCASPPSSGPDPILPRSTATEPAPDLRQHAAVIKRCDGDAIIVCDEPTYDLGSFWVGPPFKHEFVVRNTGTDIGWIQIHYSGGLHAACRVRLAPGESTAVFCSGDSTKVQGSFQKNISVTLLPPTDLICGRCRRKYDTAGHLDSCGPLSRLPTENPWCVRMTGRD